MTDLIRGTSLLDFANLVSSLGGNANSLMLAHGVDPDAAGNYERFVSYRSVAEVIGSAAVELDCPDFGMRLARSQGIGVLGPVALLIRHSETVARAIEQASRYLYVCAPPEYAALTRGPRSAVFTFGIAQRQFAYRDQMVEKGLGIAMDAFRLMLGESFVPLRVTMQHRRISAPKGYSDLFGCPVEFGSDVNSVHLPNDVLNDPILGRDAMALSLAESYLAQVRPFLILTDNVQEMIHRLLNMNRATLVAVAHEMGIHPRVLQRRLAEAGTSFEEILDDVRRALSWQLSATGIQVSQIAAMLGYSEQSSYARACRRWYGESPRQLIERRRSKTEGNSNRTGDENAPAVKWANPTLVKYARGPGNRSGILL